MKINYTNLTFTELVNKIGSSRYFDLPSMLKEAFTRLANTPSGDSRPYKVYTALLTQSGTDAPVATVLENTLGGDIVWSRYDIGEYYGTLVGTFTLDKTLCFLTAHEASSSNMGCHRDSTDAVYLSTENSTTNDYEDDNLKNASIEIRVYN